MQRLTGLILTLLLTFTGTTALAQNARPTVITIGFLDFESEASYTANRDNVLLETVKYLKTALPDFTIEPRFYTTAQLKDAVRRREVQFFLGSSGFFVSMMNEGVRDVATLVSPQFPDPNQVAAGTIFVRADRDDLKTLADLKLKVAASTDPDNFMTYQIPMGHIAHEGFDPERFFARTIFTDSRPQVVMEKVLSGEADVGLLRACMLEGIAKRRPEFRDAFRVIDRHPGARETRLGCQYSTAMFPGWTMAVTPGTPPAITHAVALALLSMRPEASASGYTWSVATDFTRVNQLFKDLKTGPYAYLRSWTLSRVWETFKPAIAAAAALFLCWVVHWLRVEALVAKRTQELKRAHEKSERESAKARAASEKLLTLSRSRAVEQLSSLFAHDMGQPLSAMRYALKGLTTLLSRSHSTEATDAERLKACLATLERQLDKASAIVGRVREYATQKDRRVDAVDLCAILDEVVGETRLVKARKLPVAVTRPDAPLWVTGNALELYLLTYNLLKNALEAAGAEGAVEVKLESFGERALLVVVNDGPTLATDDIERLGRPFASDKPQGLGLGLSIVQSIAEAHRGNLAFTPRPEGGLTVVFSAPLRDPLTLNESNSTP